MIRLFSSRTPVLGALLLGLTLLPLRAARADLGFWSQALVGTWRHPGNGDLYRFNSNATYTFTSGRAKRRAGQLSHSGHWKIVQPTEKESGGSMEGPVALVLDSRSRVVHRGNRRVVLPSRRAFRLVVDVVFDDEHQLKINRYYLGEVQWIRVR